MTCNINGVIDALGQLDLISVGGGRPGVIGLLMNK